MSARPTHCGKVCHATLLDAFKARSYLLSSARGKRGLLRAYRCKRCMAWHLTSKRPNPRKPRKGWVVGHA